MQNNKKITNRLNFDVKDKNSIEKCYFLIQLCLIEFKDTLHRTFPQSSDFLDKNENFLNSRFCLLLTEKAKSYEYPFIPLHENPTSDEDDNHFSNTHKVDISFFISAEHPDSIFDLECKRLYSIKQKHYISGKTGGINRYKLEKHGKSCTQSAIVAYMQAENFDFWHTKINTWIENEVSKTNQEVVWSANDKLQKRNNVNPILSKCQSFHKRKTLADIGLTHYWINLQ